MRSVKPTRSLGFRLSLVVVIAVFFGILTTVTFFLAQDFRHTVEAERQRLISSAAAFGAAMSANVAAGDTRGTLNVLRGIRDLPTVQYAGVTDQDGVLIAEIGGATMLIGRDGSAENLSLWSIITANTLTAQNDIVHRGRSVGTIHLHADIGGVRQRYLDSFLLAISFGAVVLIVTIFVARRRVKRIVTPLNTLTGKLAAIDQNSSLSVRLEAESNDEVGVLIDSFNDMFDRIHERDRLLKRHRDTLEETVQRRTAELVTAKEEAERANAAKSDFLATMSHEIRTPMNGMMVMAEMLSAAPLAPKHLRYSEIIARSGRGLLNIINDILDFSKIESGNMELEQIPFSIDTLIEDVASLFAERAREKSLTIATFVAPDVPAELVGDPTRVTQVVTNLVNNALKFTEDGGVTIEVHLAADQPVKAETRVLLFNVRDTGIGIAKDKIAQVFERFSQADQSITRKFGGTGLGLSISKNLVDAMGGVMSAESELGQGSTFWFEIEFPVSNAAPEKTGFEGRSVALFDSNTVSWGSVCNALLLRDAKLAETGIVGNLPDCDVLLVRSEDLPQLEKLKNDGADVKPVVVMQPFAATGSTALPKGFELAAEIQLPLRRADVALFAQAAVSGDFTAMRKESRSRRVPEELPDFSGVSVLAVDDTAVNREVLSEALKSLGVHADLADSGPAAIERVKARRYDLIFMDCSMPEMDGFEATGAIRESQQSRGEQPSRIVALTAHVTGAEATRWQEAGMDAYVAKPFTIPQLISVFEPLVPSNEEPETAQTSEQQPVAEPVLDHVEPQPATDPVVDDVDAQVAADLAVEVSAPLIAPETLEMFAMLSKNSGSSVADRIFGIFLDRAPTGLEDLKLALSAAHPESSKFAHALKSMCSSAGAKRAADICQRIEDECKSGTSADQALLAELETALAATAREMRRTMTADGGDPAAAAQEAG